MSESEPLMKCRKRRNDVKTGGRSLTRDKFGRYLFYWPNGIRHRSGMNLLQAFVWNVGTCRSNVKGDPQVETPQGKEYRCRTQGRNNS